MAEQLEMPFGVWSGSMCYMAVHIGATWEIRLNPHLTHDCYGPSEPTTQTASRSVQPLLHRRLQSVPIHNGTPLSPSKLPLPIGGSGPPS